MISVLVPAFNVEAYIENCIRAILGQTISELEVIVVDDGSTDRTAEILDKIQKEDVRINIIHQDNRGVAATRNLLIHEAKGEWIVFIDSDDLVHPQYLEKLYQAAITNDCLIAKVGYHDVTQFQAFTNELQIPTVSVHNTRDYLLGKKNAFTLWSFIFARSLWEDISFPNCRVSEDTAVLYRILYQEERMAVVLNDEMYQHLVRKEGLIGNGQFSYNLLDRLDVFEERLDYYKEKKDSELARYALLTYAMELLNDYMALGKIGDKTKQKKIHDRYKKVCNEAVKTAVSVRQRTLLWIAKFFPGIWGVLP